jgi:hypothetical protein
MACRAEASSPLRVAQHSGLAARGDCHAPRTAIVHGNAAIFQVPNTVSMDHADHLFGNCVACVRSTRIQEQGTIQASAPMQARMNDEQLHVIA